MTSFAVPVLALALGQAEYPRPNLLVEPATLKSAGARMLVLDARPLAKYDAGHIPGAVWVDHDAWSKKFATDADAKTWADALGKLGVAADRPTVVVDDGTQKEAARVWWLLRHLGASDVRLLNGGMKAWAAVGGPTSTDAVRPTATTFAAKVRPETLADKDRVLNALRSRSAQIVDARSEAEHCGDKKLAKRGGHIPGSLHLEWSDAFDKTSGKFLAPAELTKLLKASGIDVTKPAITYCQSGGRAAVMAFTLELMGGPPAANYYRSWGEWGNDDALPIVPKK